LTKEFEWNGVAKQYPAGQAFKWKRLTQTPQIWFDNLESIDVWPESRKKDLPIWPVLEDNWKTILAETEAAYEKSDAYNNAISGNNGTLSKGKMTDAQLEALKNETDGMVSHAYSFLFKGGNWDQILLYHGRQYTEACEKSFPETCKMLKQTLPKRPQHDYPWASNQNEQVLVLRLKVGTDTETHCGPANNILNVHLGLKGLDGAVLIVDGKNYTWEQGKVIPWDGSFDHKVHCLNCKEDRYILMVRYMHPDITPDHYRGNKRTHFEEIPADWIEKWDKEGVKAEL